MKKTTAVSLFFVAAVLAGLFMQWSYRAPAAKPVEDETSPKETFKQREVGMPLDMQAVEGAVGVAGYNGTPPLLGSEPKPLSEKPYEMANDSELFEFQNNKVGADCCPSPFSSDLGCICLTEEQRKRFETRAGNRASQ
jgi:hypothetical protein